MFGFIGRSMYRWRYLVIAIWSLGFLAAVPFIPQLASALNVGGFSSERTEAAAARAIVARELGSSASTMLVIYSAEELLATSPDYVMAVERSLANVRRLPAVEDIVLPTISAGMVSEDLHTAYALVGLTLSPEEAQRIVPAFEAALTPQPGFTISVSGAPAFYRDIETVSQRDLRRAEIVVFPIALVALLVVFGSVVAATVPLIVGGMSVAMVLGSVYLATQFTDLSIFVLNLATMLGLGLAVDYSLFVTSRFREELRRTNNDVPRAVERTIETAGQAVFFSGTTVLIGLLGLSLFEFMFLRSVGIAGVIVVAWSTIAALTLLPAVISVLGPRIDRFLFRWAAVPGESTTGFWVRLSNAVMARPIAFLIPTLAVLLLLGLPFRHANISSPDATILPGDLPSRQAFDQLVAEFGAGEISPFIVVIDAPGRTWDPATLSEIHRLVVRLEADPRVVRVQSVISPYFSQGNAIAIASFRRWLDDQGVETGLSRLASPNAAVILVYTPFLPNDDRSKDLLQELRSLDFPGMEILVAGGTAEIVDSVSAMYADFPKAVALIVVATYLVLLLLFRSLLLPLKAILMNALSILASYGALVWVFQDGNLSQWLGFSALGFVEASLPIIMFCVLFGLSMDYEVFLLSRIREEWLRTGDNTRAVALGMQRSGRIITSAALLVVVVTASFVSADVVIIKALGFGIAVAVFLDATIVRALLVPSTMKLLGDWNWWLPTPIQRLLPQRQWSEE